MLKFLVTCGRGFENFVVSEIQEKIQDISDVFIVNEGKIIFKLSACAQKHNASVKLGRIYDLKMIERIFLLLHYNDISDSEISTGTAIVKEICAGVDWEDTTDKVSALISMQYPNSAKTCSCSSVTKALTSIKKPTDQQLPTSEDSSTAVKRKSSIELDGADDKLSKRRKYTDSFQTTTTCTEEVKNSQHCATDQSSSPEIVLSGFRSNCSSKESHKIDSQSSNAAQSIEFRASCRATGKWKTKKKKSANDFQYSVKGLHANELNDLAPDTSTNTGVLSDTVQPDSETSSTTVHCQSKSDDNIAAENKKSFRKPSKDTLTDSREKFIFDDSLASSTPSSMLSCLVEEVLQRTSRWQLNWDRPHVDVYFNITDLHVLLGVALRRTPLSLRCYIPHIGLRSTVCHLMLRLALQQYFGHSHKLTPCSHNLQQEQEINSNFNSGTWSSYGEDQNLCNKRLNNQNEMPNIKEKPTYRSNTYRLDSISGPCVHESLRNSTVPLENFILLDPMCGMGTILAEAVHCFKMCQVIGCDISESQLAFAQCNLLEVPQSTSVSLLRADVANLPLRDRSVNAVVCDFPFGQLHEPHLNDNTQDTSVKLNEILKDWDELKRLLYYFLKECSRVVVESGVVVVLLPTTRETDLDGVRDLASSHGFLLHLVARHKIAMGNTTGVICILQNKSSGERS